MNKQLYCIIKPDGTISLQRAPYIEDGPYISVKGSSYTVYEIAQYGGREWEDGTFSTLAEALKKYYWIVENHT